MKYIQIIISLFILLHSNINADSKDKHAEIEVNDYLGILVHKIDLKEDKIEIHLCNIKSTPIKASFSKEHFEGDLIIKTENEVKVFMHKTYRSMLLTSFWLHPAENLKEDKIVKYKHAFNDFVDLHQKTDLKKYLSTMKETEIHVKVMAPRVGVYPSIQAKSMSMLRALQGNWQKVKLTPNN